MLRTCLFGAKHVGFAPNTHVLDCDYFRYKSRKDVRIVRKYPELVKCPVVE